MSYIAHLDLAMNHSLKGDRWQELARNGGAPIREYDGPTDIRQIGQFIRDAAGMILPYENFLRTPELVSCIAASIAGGRRLLVHLGPNSLEFLNPFLVAYGIKGTRVAAHSTDPRVSHPRLIEVCRSASPSSFRNHPIVEGVQSLIIQQPNAIEFGGRATPIINLSADSHLLVEQTTDFPASWTSPEISCIVLSEVMGAGGVLALACGFLHDPYQGPFGTTFPGITAADNSRFAANILRWLAGSHSPSRDRAAEAFELVDHIERSFVEYMHRKLCATYADWWTDGIPVEIRKKCAQRCEEEANKLPKSAYLDLLDSKDVVEKNWQVFAPDFDMVGWRGGKKLRSVGLPD